MEQLLGEMIYIMQCLFSGKKEELSEGFRMTSLDKPGKTFKGGF